jgi:hypothetical protein
LFPEHASIVKTFIGTASNPATSNSEALIDAVVGLGLWAYQKQIHESNKLGDHGTDEGMNEKFFEYLQVSFHGYVPIFTPADN